MKTCKACGHEQLMTNDFCEKCGKQEFVAKSQREPNAPPEEPAEKDFFDQQPAEQPAEQPEPKPAEPKPEPVDHPEIAAFEAALDDLDRFERELPRQQNSSKRTLPAANEHIHIHIKLWLAIVVVFLTVFIVYAFNKAPPLSDFPGSNFKINKTVGTPTQWIEMP